MKRYYVEFNGATTGSIISLSGDSGSVHSTIAGVYLYVIAHSPEHVKEMFPLFNIVTIDQVD